MLRLINANGQSIFTPLACICLLIQLVVINAYSQEIIFPPNTPVCVEDLNNSGDVSETNELETCGTGQLYNPITDLPGPDTGLLCPISKAACERPEVNTCQIDSTPCGELDTSCTRPRACVGTDWDVDEGVGELIYSAEEPEYWYCPSNDTTYYSLADVIAGCREEGEIVDPVVFMPGDDAYWHCARTDQNYTSEAAAIAACTYQVDVGTDYYYQLPNTPGEWFCSTNGVTYPTEAAAIAGCRDTGTVDYPVNFYPGNYDPEYGGTPDLWYCTYTNQFYTEESDAEAACSVEEDVAGSYSQLPDTPGDWYCPANGNTYSSEADAIAGCRLYEDSVDTVTYFASSDDQWYCSRDDTVYDDEEDAIAACTYEGDIGVAPYEYYATVPEQWYCVNNGNTYYTEADAMANCRDIVNYEGWDCPLTPHNDQYTSLSDCQDACEETGACAIEIGNFECPWGGFDCINETEGEEDYFCSPNACGTFEDEGTYSPVVDSFTPNDGNIDPDDGCTDQIQIFNGKAESCRLPGIASAYQNCCNEADEDLLTDSQGSIGETVLYSAGINALSSAGAAAYAAYTGLPAGTTIGAAAGQTASAFQTALLESLSSTTMIVAVGVVAVTTYLENACPPEGVVTAIKKKSNQCVLIGEKCTTRILGSCLQKREVHCCFNSLMATLVQVGGRDQLGMSFGTVNAPDCRGFTPEEFQSIDFSKIDLTDYYNEIETRAQSDIEDEITDVIDDAADSI